MSNSHTEFLHLQRLLQHNLCPLRVPSHHGMGRAPHTSTVLGAAWGATSWELLPANTCTLYQLVIDLEKFMALASHDTFTRNGSFPQMM